MSTTDEELDGLAQYSAKPFTPEHPYFADAEQHLAWAWPNLVWPAISDCDFTAVIDLAAGHGRNCTELRKVAEHILVLDIQPGNVDVCRERFAGDPKFEFAVNNGYDLRPAGDADYTLVYCFDAMVHFHRDVIKAYLVDTLRVLKPGGHGFFHHSNYTGSDDWWTAPGNRAYMSKDLFAEYAREAGLAVVSQRVIDWGDPEHDCLTLVRRPA
jgi:ubiquinone/menaquinone biosynthesis C-methylase UbiE